MRRPNHASRFEGIAKTKLQASRASDTETLQSQATKAGKKRLSLSRLEILHGRHGSRKLLLGQQLTGSDVALEKKLVTWNSNPVDVAKPAPNAHTNAVLRVVDLSRCCVAPS